MSVSFLKSSIMKDFKMLNLNLQIRFIIKKIKKIKKKKLIYSKALK